MCHIQGLGGIPAEDSKPVPPEYTDDDYPESAQGRLVSGSLLCQKAAGLATEKFKMLVPWKPKVQKAAKFGNQALTVNPLQKKVFTGTSKDRAAVQSPETPSQKLLPETKIEESTAAREKAVTESEVQASRQMSHQERDLR